MNTLNALTKLEIKAQRQAKIKDKSRSAEILGVFAKHNFYANGFTPEELRTTLEDLGPTYVKIGQIASSRTDLLPEEYCRELEKLRSNVAPLDAAIARDVIERETGKRIDEIYSEFRDEPLGSASIAQAHFAVLKDGTKVVTKVQRPLIADMMRKDFVLLKKLAGTANAAASGGALDLVGVIGELEKVTEEELDFRVEAENTRKFRELCIEDDTVVSCPTIIDELTTERILTMTYVDGYSISKKERVEEEGYDRVAIGTALIENYLHQVLDVGTFHGDPHQGNIMISHGVPYWIDFGMIGHVSDKSINALQDIVFALIQRDAEGLTEAALSIGKISGKLNKGKLLDDVEGMIQRYGSLKDVDAGELLSELTGLLNEYHIQIPGEYTMLVRSLVTAEGVIAAFCPELNLTEYLTKKMLQRAKDNFDVRAKLTEAVEQVVASGLRTVRLPNLAFDVLKGLVKGRLKLNFELSGYEEMLTSLNETVKNVVLAVLACVLFMGSCQLYTATSVSVGIQFAALFGLVVSVALAIYAVTHMTKRK